jgi:hypothetical protein
VEAEKNKFSPWRVWKWHTVLLELALFTELIIVPYFWIALFPIVMSDKVHPFVDKSLPERMGLVMDHSFPFTTLVIEFLFLSGTPIVARHFSCAIIFGWGYLIFNCIYTINV